MLPADFICCQWEYTTKPWACFCVYNMPCRLLGVWGKWSGECAMADTGLQVCWKVWWNALGGRLGMVFAPRTRHRELPICHIGRILRAGIQEENHNLEATNSRLKRTWITFEPYKNNLPPEIVRICFRQNGSISSDLYCVVLSSEVCNGPEHSIPGPCCQFPEATAVWPMGHCAGVSACSLLSPCEFRFLSCWVIKNERERKEHSARNSSFPRILQVVLFFCRCFPFVFCCSWLQSIFPKLSLLKSCEMVG